MVYEFIPRGVCSRKMRLTVEQDRIIKAEVWGGCDGNLQAVTRLVQGMRPVEAVGILKGIRCGNKPTSCPDQLAQGLERMATQRIKAE